MCLEKRISTKNLHTELEIFICMSPVLLAAGNLHLSQHVSFWAELSQASSFRLPGHWHAASGLSESSRSRHIPATSSLKLGNMQAELPPPPVFFHCQGTKRQEPDPSPMSLPSFQAASTKHPLSFFFAETRKISKCSQICHFNQTTTKTKWLQNALPYCCKSFWIHQAMLFTSPFTSVNCEFVNTIQIIVWISCRFKELQIWICWWNTGNFDCRLIETFKPYSNHVWSFGDFCCHSIKVAHVTSLHCM